MATSGSSTARTTRRSWSSGSIPRSSPTQKLPPTLKRRDIWERRFREINDWERYLTDQGFRIVKLFLNLSKEEQRRRFLSRIDEPEKNWKFWANDATERSHWDDYQKAFSDVLSNTSTDWAPWYVIPADDKPFARVAAAGVLANALIEIDPHFPKVRPARRVTRSRSRRSSSRQKRPEARRPIRSRTSWRPRQPSGKKSRKSKRRPAIEVAERPVARDSARSPRRRIVR